MKTVTLFGHTYRSVAEAWRMESPAELTLEAVRWRLRNGWETEDAFTFPTVIPESRRNFKVFREITAYFEP